MSTSAGETHDRTFPGSISGISQSSQPHKICDIRRTVPLGALFLLAAEVWVLAASRRVASTVVAANNCSNTSLRNSNGSALLARAVIIAG